MNRLRSMADEAGIVAFVLVALVVGGLVFMAHNADKAADVIDPNPAIPPELADHVTRGDGLARGPMTGATPNKTLPRPDAFLTDRGISYTWKGSPNWSGRGTNPIEAVTIHVTGPGSMAGMASWFNNPSSQVSATFGIGKDGEVHQYVEMADVAWHNGICNRPTGTLPVQWCAQGINPNLRTIGIELLLAGPAEPLDDFPKMKASLLTLLGWITDTTGIVEDRTHIIGHYEVDGINRSTDPRCCVNLDTIVAELVGDGVATSTPVPLPPGSPVTPPSYAAECWSASIDPRFGNRWNWCPGDWVFPDGSFYRVSTNTHYWGNGVPK